MLSLFFQHNPTTQYVHRPKLYEGSKKVGKYSFQSEMTKYRTQKSMLTKTMIQVFYTTQTLEAPKLEEVELTYPATFPEIPITHVYEVTYYKRSSAIWNVQFVINSMSNLCKRISLLKHH